MKGINAYQTAMGIPASGHSISWWMDDFPARTTLGDYGAGGGQEEKKKKGGLRRRRQPRSSRRLVETVPFTTGFCCHTNRRPPFRKPHDGFMRPIGVALGMQSSRLVARAADRRVQIFDTALSGGGAVIISWDFVKVTTAGGHDTTVACWLILLALLSWGVAAKMSGRHRAWMDRAGAPLPPRVSLR